MIIWNLKVHIRKSKGKYMSGFSRFQLQDVYADTSNDTPHENAYPPVVHKYQCGCGDTDPQDSNGLPFHGTCNGLVFTIVSNVFSSPWMVNEHVVKPVRTAKKTGGRNE